MKKLEAEELENVTGGRGFYGTNHVKTDPVTPQEAYQLIGQNFFVSTSAWGNSNGTLYVKLTNCYEKYTLWWSNTIYCLTVISADFYCGDHFPVGNAREANSLSCTLYKSCNGYNF